MFVWCLCVSDVVVGSNFFCTLFILLVLICGSSPWRSIIFNEILKKKKWFHDDAGFGCVEEDDGVVVHQMGLTTSSNIFTYINEVWLKSGVWCTIVDLVHHRMRLTKMHLNLRYASKFIKHIYYVFTNNKKFQELTLSYRKKE